ncbi:MULTISPECIES: ArsR/SmtB family transcription factor [Aeromicrobium]|uniref:ArsR/SmtB family transcription factor n=1 Tax=Aeromicrobium TaxID=2040 RepID=UPI002580DCCE|nr:MULTISPECIES: metalloregulator ArsR/SmtB family transcription factor [Aeromicrobium]
MSDPIPTPRRSSLDHPQRPDLERLREAADVFALIGEPTRLELLWLLTEGPATAGELADAVEASRTAVSQHLAKLRLAGLVDAQRDGRHQVYRILSGHVARLVREGLNQADHLVSGEEPHL